MSKPPISASDSSQQKQNSSVPRWETATMVLSFVALWAWFLARQNAARAGDSLSFWWHVPLGVSLALLIWIFVRRTKRAMQGIKAVNPARRGRPGRD